MPSFSEYAGLEPVEGDQSLPQWLHEATTRAPLYGTLPDRGWPAHCHEAGDLEAASARLVDPFGGRHDPSRRPDAFVQVAQDLSLFWALGVDDLARMAGVLADAWEQLGIVEGDRIALYDYATSPMVVFASRAFIPHLGAGAADILGCLPVCNDGLPELADRCVHILEYVQPSFLFIDADVVEPLIRVLNPSTPRPRRIVVTADERPASSDQISDWASGLGAEVVQMLRCDAALFLAAPCPSQSMTFHPSPRAFVVEVLNPDGSKRSNDAEGRLAISNLALRSSIVARYAASFEGSVRTGPCRCRSEAAGVVITNA